MAEQPETRRVSKVENLELAAKVLLDVVWDHPALHPAGRKEDCRLCQAIKGVSEALKALP